MELSPWPERAATVADALRVIAPEQVESSTIENEIGFDCCHIFFNYAVVSLTFIIWIFVESSAA
jgi:hypothetical protein